MAARYSYRGPPQRALRATASQLERASAIGRGHLTLEDPAAIILYYQRRFAYHTSYLYGLCRLLEPDIVVETGVKFGASSAFILQALADNRKGHLYSIDLPGQGAVPAHRAKGPVQQAPKATGYTVPEHLRDRWTLILGDARKELPPLLAQIGPVGLFHHDSAHTYGQVTFELEEAYPSMREGGLVVCDDAPWNNAFLDFAARRLLSPRVAAGVGVVRKPALPKTSSAIPAVPG